jgi:hypothetical protein
MHTVVGSTLECGGGVDWSVQRQSDQETRQKPIMATAEYSPSSVSNVNPLEPKMVPAHFLKMLVYGMVAFENLCTKIVSYSRLRK